MIYYINKIVVWDAAMENIFFYDTSIGRVAIIDNGMEITAVGLKDRVDCKDKNVCETELIKIAANQLNEYLEGKRKDFELPLSEKGMGSALQYSIWRDEKLQAGC